ncbi:hypothetical protein CBOM_07747 [Ceraceosorus bombacis]|uniref:Uncharacterized protein n=1 Tax=Ceraceosorus bombacis TaxID=401625 RepID=A0A0P1BLC2_9BASI|nr:hypothetical protein CBOM_07747 [Ceraceosorus bombacis]
MSIMGLESETAHCRMRLVLRQSASALQPGCERAHSCSICPLYVWSHSHYELKLDLHAHYIFLPELPPLRS